MKIAAWTNDPAGDNLGNQIKRMFEDDYTMRVVRWGLGPKADGVGLRAPYEAFREARCNLERTAHLPWGGYVYARDTTIVCNEVAMGTTRAQRASRDAARVLTTTTSFDGISI